MGEFYAKSNGIHLKLFPANWNLYKKSAGYIRNEEMAKYADGCVIFWDGYSKGSQHMYNLALKHKLKTKLIKYK